MSLASIGRSILITAVFAALAVWSTYPLIWNLGDSVPGASAGDNVAALWNTWWFFVALRDGHSMFWTDALFVPIGTQLSLHTHTLTHSVMAAGLAAGVSLTAAHNLAMLIGLTLNGLVTYWLARQLGCAGEPAFLAGWLFAASAFVQIHLLGHVNLVHAWVIPLFVLTVHQFARGPSAGRGVLLGSSAAIVLYTDYYFAVYCGVLVLLWGVMILLRPSLDRRSTRWPKTGAILIAIAVLIVAVGAIVAATGGTAIQVGGLRLSLRSARNPIALATLAALAGWYCLRPWRVRLDGAGHRLSDWAWPVTVAMATAALIVSPLAIALVHVIRSGDYATQTVLWRSSPPGGDLLTLLLGHPRHAFTGSLTFQWYSALGIDLMEQSLWIGAVPVLVVLIWLRAAGRSSVAKLYLVAGVTFALLSLGPFLRVAGRDTGIVLPHAALRYLPGIGNARMPGRAIVVVQLSAAILLALAWTRRRPARWLATPLAAVILIESAPGPTPLFRLPPADEVDRTLHALMEPGAVIELPTGVRDGFGEMGRFDHRALVHQMAHHRSLAGGFVARLSPKALAYYRDDPFSSQLLDLSAAADDPRPFTPGISADAVNRGYRFLVVNRDLLDELRLSRASIEAAGFQFMTRDGARELFRAQ